MINRFKYIRIQGRENSILTGKPVGVFSLNWRKIREGLYSKDDAQLFYTIDNWFKANLPEPPFYAEGNEQGAITYYKTENFDDMRSFTIDLLNLLDKYNVSYDVIYTNHIGKIIYEDKYQIGVID